MSAALLHTDLPLANKRTGKVRDLYDVALPDGRPGLLIVATDRLSAFDVVMANGVPGRGVVLTQISRFWFDLLAPHVQHHLVSTDAADIPGLSSAQQQDLQGRVMLCEQTTVVPVECVARGFLAGTGWKDYQRTGAVCGISLPEGLRNGDELPEPIFTPSTKAATGHDENISFAAASDLIGAERARWLRDTTLSLYGEARAYARERGILLADTKFEFGIRQGGQEIVLIDEVFTPDSSRFWPADQWTPGREQDSFDKQFVRNFLEGEVVAGRWDRSPPGPSLPEEVLDATLERYLEAYRRLTGRELALPQA